MIRPLFLLTLVFLGLVACSTADKELNENINEIDKYLRDDSLRHSEILNQLSVIGTNFVDSTDRVLNEDRWLTSVKYKWNRDSSIVFISSKKNIETDYKRETILNIRDTALIITRFQVSYDKSRYETPGYLFFEEIKYLSKRDPIKIWAKFNYTNTGIADTTDFLKSRFLNRTRDYENDGFKNEFEYLQRILNTN